MAEIILAMGPSDGVAFRNIGAELVNEILGVKILTNEAYDVSHHDKNHPTVDYAVISRFARIFGANNISIDAKLGNDNSDEMSKTIKTIVERVVRPPISDANRLKSLTHAEQPKPNFISALVDLPQKAIEQFLQEAQDWEFTPVLHLTSSRFTDVDFKNRNTTAANNAVWRTRLARQSGFVAGHVIVAAADAEVVKNENPDLILHVTGSILADSDDVEPGSLRHPRWALMEEILPFAGVFVIGGSILKSPSPARALKDRLSVANG